MVEMDTRNYQPLPPLSYRFLYCWDVLRDAVTVFPSEDPRLLVAASSQSLSQPHRNTLIKITDYDTLSLINNTSSMD